MGVGEGGVDEPVRAHHGELGEVLDGVAVLDLDDDRGHLLDELVEAARGAAFVDLRQVRLEELGVLLVAERCVVHEVDGHECLRWVRAVAGLVAGRSVGQGSGVVVQGPS